MARTYVSLTNDGTSLMSLPGGFKIRPGDTLNLTKERFDRLLSLVDLAAVANLTLTFATSMDDENIPASITRDTEYQADIANGFTVTSGNIKLNDSSALTLGTGSDAALMFDGTNTRLTAGAGNITVTGCRGGTVSLVGENGANIALTNEVAIGATTTTVTGEVVLDTGNLVVGTLGATRSYVTGTGQFGSYEANTRIVAIDGDVELYPMGVDGAAVIRTGVETTAPIIYGAAVECPAEHPLEDAYEAGELDSEAKIITAINNTNTALNSIIDALQTFGIIDDTEA